MQCRDVEAVIENEGLSPLPEAVRAHAASCAACSDLVADFSAILSAAEALPTEVEPPKRVWVALKNQLEAEGIIKTPAAISLAPQRSWLENLARILRGRVLATASVAIVIVAVGVVQIWEKPRPTPPEPFSDTAQTLRQVEENVPMVTQAGSLSNQSVVDDSLRQNLKSLNQFIEECRRRLKEDPSDELAREYLSV